MKQLLRLAILALFLLLVAGWGAQATAGVSAPSDVDHYKCYKVKGQAFNPKPVAGLQDEFESDTDIVAKPVLLCNPAMKDDGAVLGVERHLVCYQIKGKQKLASKLTLDVDNQFAPDQIMKTGKKEKLLCVPSSKFCIDDQGVKTDCPNEAFNH